ncbi:MAG: outer membrane lipoprotein-sorting protein [Candidatus Aminicenantes bacterium]|nr:outer membrane lipoprotein-sorting protein [Candidatus Aminicenantes bacterium]
MRRNLYRNIYQASGRFGVLMLVDSLRLFAVGALSVAILLCSPILVQPAAAQTQKLSGQEILKRVDDNITADNKIMTAKMIIHLRRVSRTVEFKSYIQGTEKAFTEYLAPPRERGTKMLKLGKQLWMYSPWTERTILISGHMLRQSVMGSDLSYEDMLEDPRLSNSYTAELVGEEVIRLGEGIELGEKIVRHEPPAGVGSDSYNKLFANCSLVSVVSRPAESEFSGVSGYEIGSYENLRTEMEEYQAPETRSGVASPQGGQTGKSSDVVPRGTEINCWILELTARSEDVAYPKRKLWVDKERFVVVREERYASSGMLLKKTEVLSLKQFDKRWVPDRAVFKDMLKAGEGTEFVVDSIEFNARIPDYIFTRAALK